MSGGFCAYTAQGEYVCTTTQAQMSDDNNKEHFFSAMDKSSLIMCPTNPFERPNCTTECSMLVKNDACAHLDADTDTTNHQKCKLCRQGCCRERGIPPHGLIALSLTK